jgi:hypothetical protein
MATVIVLGAGASVAEALTHHPKRDKDRPPLDADFFERAKRFAREPSLILRLESHAETIGHPSPFTEPTSLERYLGLLYFGLIHKPTRADISAYYTLLRLYNRELLATTNWIIGRKKGTLLRLVRTSLDHGALSAIVTFNHDLLAESALQALPPRICGHRWCLRHGYGFESGEVRTLRRTASTEVWPDCAAAEVPIPVYKLHGSLNWLFATRNLDPSVNLARQKKVIYITRRTKPRPDLTINLHDKGRRYYGWPVVVPPVYDKQGFIQQHLQTVWDRAFDALLNATRVIFFGYSFPTADYHARYFFRRLAAQNPALRTPVVINPDFSVATTCREVLAAERVETYLSVDHYLHNHP